MAGDSAKDAVGGCAVAPVTEKITWRVATLPARSEIDAVMVTSEIPDGSTSADIEGMVEELRKGVAGLEACPKADQQRVLHNLLAEVRLAYDKPIKLVLWLPDLPSGPPMLLVAGVPPEKREPVPARVSPSGHGFSHRSVMVEVGGTGIRTLHVS